MAAAVSQGAWWLPLLSAVAEPARLAAAAPDVPELGYGWALMKMLAALVVVCALAYLALRYGLRRIAAPRPGGARHLRVVDRCPLSANRSLWIVRAGGRYLVLGESEGGISTLAELDPAAFEGDGHADDEEVGPRSRSFLELLKRGAAGDRDREARG